MNGGWRTRYLCMVLLLCMLFAGCTKSSEPSGVQDNPGFLDEEPEADERVLADEPVELQELIDTMKLTIDRLEREQEVLQAELDEINEVTELFEEQGNTSRAEQYRGLAGERQKKLDEIRLDIEKRRGQMEGLQREQTGSLDEDFDMTEDYELPATITLPDGETLEIAESATGQQTG